MKMQKKTATETARSYSYEWINISVMKEAGSKEQQWLCRMKRHH